MLRAPQVKVSDKVMIPQDNHPDINFVGLLIGPRGNTLKNMEKDTGAKIIIRGKGSVKEGKVGRKDGQPLPGEDEPLHAYVTATDPEAVKKAVNKIKEIIQQGVEVPEGSNELRKMQLRELALLNGTLREDGQMRCTNCGAADHKTWQCQDKANVTNNVVCTSCGAVGHIAGDCKQRRPGGGFGQYGEPAAPGSNKIDEEYLSFMAELGDGAPPPPGAGSGGERGGARGGGGFSGQSSGQGRQALPAPSSSGGNWGGWGGGGGGHGGHGGGERGQQSSSAKPLMSQSVQPPWGQQKNGSNGNSESWNYPPPPPPGGRSWGPHGSWGGNNWNAPPPPPPRSVSQSVLLINFLTNLLFAAVLAREQLRQSRLRTGARAGGEAALEGRPTRCPTSWGLHLLPRLPARCPNTSHLSVDQLVVQHFAADFENSNFITFYR